MLRLLTLCIAGLILTGTLTWLSTTPEIAVAEETSTEPAPVEDSMHEFMEYVFQPTYKRLKVEMAKETKERAEWKAIKADSLILAEGGNLLLMRKPKSDLADWQKFSVEVRSSGGSLYKAAGAKDAEGADKHYKLMLKSCNACHTKFANGKYQLTP